MRLDVQYQRSSNLSIMTNPLLDGSIEMKTNEVDGEVD
jgi:hypothetical protein